MNIKELRKDSLVSDWLDNLNAADTTEEAYLYGLQAYIDFTGMTPDELITEAEDEIKTGVLMRRRKIKSHLIGFRKHLQTKGLADFSVRSRMTGVQSFYNSFEIELPKIKGEKRRARALEENKAIPKKEDIQDVLKICDPLERAVLLVGISSGLASNEIRNLKIKLFKNGYDPETRVTTLEITRGKTGVEFITFLSPEASIAVCEYLEFRGREVKASTTKRKGQLEKQKIVNDDGYLFVLRQVPDEFIETHNDELRKLTKNAVQKLYRAISDKAKKNTKSGCYNVVRSHTMRKYFNSVLLNAGCDSFHSEFFMGHALDDTRAAYFRASPEKLKEIYQKFVPYLTIQKEADVSESPEYQKIKYENSVLQAETARHIVERSELQEVKADIREMKEARMPMDKVTEFVLELQKTDPAILNSILEVLKTSKE